MRMTWGQLRQCQCFSSLVYWLSFSSLNDDRGMKTIYVQRTTEDLIENMDQVRDDVDFFIDGTSGDEKCGFGELADILQAWQREMFRRYEAHSGVSLSMLSVRSTILLPSMQSSMTEDSILLACFNICCWLYRSLTVPRGSRGETPQSGGGGWKVVLGDHGCGSA